jgi:predicted transcriptional regulator
MNVIDQIRKILTSTTRHYVLKEKYPPSYNLHLNQFTGAGKTTITLREMINTDSFFIFLTNNHKIAGEQILKQRALYDLLQIESRKRLCVNEDYKKLAENGINIKHFCHDCAYMNICEYYQRILEIWDEPQSWVGVHHHLGGLVNGYIIENNVDIVIIDENFTNAIYKHTKYYYTNIVQTMNLMTKMNSCNEKDIINEFLQEFAFALQNAEINIEHLYSLTYQYFHKKFGSPDALLDFAETYEIRLANFYFNKGKIFRNVVTPLVRAIIEIDRNYLPLHNPNCFKFINAMFFVLISKKTNIKYIDMAYYDVKSLDLPCKVILLDATTPTGFYQNLFTRQLKPLQAKININTTIYQLTTAKYVMKTLDTSPTAKNRLLNLVRLIVEKHNEPVLVLSRSKYEDEIKAINPILIQTDHYPVVGSNEYEDINIGIAFGTPVPNYDILERQVNLLKYDFDKMLYTTREAYVIQGMGRLRFNLKQHIPTYYYLLTNLPLNINVDIKPITIGKLENLLQGEIKTTYSTEETEDRIRADILASLKKSDLRITNLMKIVSGNTAVKQEIIRRLVSENMIEKYQGIRNTNGGRRPVMLRIKS